MVEINEHDVIEAVRSALSDPVDASMIRVRPIGREGVWAAALYDSEGRPHAGAGWLVGPNGAVFSYSSNPAIHDFDLAVLLLEAAYAEKLADRLDPEMFSDRLRQITDRRSEQVRAFVNDLRAGSLRPHTRVLP